MMKNSFQIITLVLAVLVLTLGQGASAQTPGVKPTVTERILSGLKQADTYPDIKTLQPGNTIWSCSTYLIQDNQAVLAEGSRPSFNFLEVKDEKGTVTGFESKYDKTTHTFNALFNLVTKGERQVLGEDVSKQGMMIYLSKVKTQLGDMLLLEINSLKPRASDSTNLPSVLVPGETTLGYQFCIPVTL